MAADRYHVIFSGRVLPGQDPAEVRRRVGQMFRIEGEQLERLFSGAPIAVKKDIDLDMASRLRDAFKAAGALVELKKTEFQAEDPAAPAARRSAHQEPGAPPTAARPAASQELKLAPPRTGSLIDCAPEEERANIPDISAMSLAEPGAQVAPPSEEPSAPIPDLSGIELAEPGAQVGREQEPPPDLRVDTSELELSPARTGSLEGYAREEPAVRIPSIDHLRVVEPDKGS